MRVWLAMLGMLGGLWLTAAAVEPNRPSVSFLNVTAPDKEAYLRLFRMGLDIPEQVAGSIVTVLGTEAEKAWLEARGYTV